MSRPADASHDEAPPALLVVVPVMLAAAAVAWALYAMWAHAIMHWYADAWRANLVLLDMPWWRAALVPDNSHRLVTSQVLWWIDVHAFDGDQRLLRIVGIGWMLASLLVIVRAVTRAADSPRWVRAQVLLVLVLGVAWLGNARMLAHPYEAVHVYLVMLLIMVAASLVARATIAPAPRGARIALAGAGTLAAFVFGSGGALLPAVAVVLVITRARLVDHVTVWTGAAVAALLFFALPGAGPASGSLDVAPVVQADLTVRWLTTPVVYVLLPALDPAVAARIPVASISALAVPVAASVQSVLGDVWLHPTGQRVLGVLTVAWLLHASLVAWRGRRPQLAAFGLVLAWCGLGIGVLVAMVRHEYLLELPRQVHASRYVPWSCLFWAGLTTTTLAQYGRHARPSRVAALVGIVGLAVLASNVGGHAVSRQEAAIASDQSKAARAGTTPTTWGETDPRDFLAALPVARQARIGPWAGVPADPAPIPARGLR